MTEVVLRIRAPNGLQRLTIKTSSTINDLKNEIHKLTGLEVADQQLRIENAGGPTLSLPGSSKVSSIPQLEDGLQIWVVAMKPMAGEMKTIISEDQRKKQQEDARLEKQRAAFDEKIKKQEEEQKKAKEEYKRQEEEKKANEMIAEEQKGDKKKSKKAEEMEAKHVPFDEYVAKSKGPPRAPFYRVDPTCTAHEPYPKALCMKCVPQSAIMKRQPYRHVDYAEFMNAKEMSNFVLRWSQKGFTLQRAGILYGYFAEDPNYPLGVRAIVEAIYEPPQIEDVMSVEILEDPHQTKVDMIAEALGFERIGWVFTSLVREKGLTSYEVRMASRLQEQHIVVHPTGYKVSKFVTVVLKHDGQNVAPDVYMVSDQCQAMERDGVFAEPETHKELGIREPIDKMDIIPTVIAENKEVKKVDPDFFIVNINHGHPKHNKFSYMKHSDFPVENRDKPQTPSDIKDYMRKYGKEKPYLRFADFHFLVYLSKVLDVDTACLLADIVRNESDYVSEDIDMILNSLQ